MTINDMPLVVLTDDFLQSISVAGRNIIGLDKTDKKVLKINLSDGTSIPFNYKSTLEELMLKLPLYINVELGETVKENIFRAGLFNLLDLCPIEKYSFDAIAFFKVLNRDKTFSEVIEVHMMKNPQMAEIQRLYLILETLLIPIKSEDNRTEGLEYFVDFKWMKDDHYITSHAWKMWTTIKGSRLLCFGATPEMTISHAIQAFVISWDMSKDQVVEFVELFIKAQKKKADKWGVARK